MTEIPGYNPEDEYDAPDSRRSFAKWLAGLGIGAAGGYAAHKSGLIKVVENQDTKPSISPEEAARAAEISQKKAEVQKASGLGQTEAGIDEQAEATEQEAKNKEGEK